MEGSNSKQQPSQQPTSSSLTGSTVGISVGGNPIVYGSITNYVNASPSSSQASATVKSSFRCKMPLPTPHYQGRAGILGKIMDHFVGASTQPISCWRRMITIVGMGGIGKSETASKFANKHREVFHYTAWINAETEQGALDSFLSLAKTLKMVPQDRERADLELVKEVYRYLDAEYNDEVLLIFDNAIKLQSDETDFGIFEYLPTEDLPNQRFPFVIITSQTPDWQKGIETIQLEELSEEESLSFFRSTFKISSSECDEAFKNLYDHLQGYPLAMTLAVSNIDFEPEMDSSWLQEQIELYVEKFEKEDSSILTQKINQNWSSKYNKTLSTVWQMCFQRLHNEPNGAKALMLLQAVSFFHVPVNTYHLQRACTECPFCPGTPDWMKFRSLNESIRLLEKYHLVDCILRPIDYSDQLKALQSNAENNSQDLSSKFQAEVKSSRSFWCELRVHRLIQLFVRLDMDCSVVLKDILRFLAFWAKENYVRQLNVSAVEEAFGRTILSSRALAFVGLLSLQGNSAARRIIQSSTAPVDDPAATIWRVLQLDKNIETLNEEAIEVLRAFIGLSTSEKSLIDKRCFAYMALEMLVCRRIFPYVRDDGTSAAGIFLQSLMEIEGIACELFSTCCSLIDVCSLPLLCTNVHRTNAATFTVLAGNRIIEDLTAADNSGSFTALIRFLIRSPPIRNKLRAFREFLDRGKSKWHQYQEELTEICNSEDSWETFESEVESCGLDQLKLKQVFSSIFDKIWSATDKKNFDDKERLAHTFKDLDFVIHKFLYHGRYRDDVKITHLSLKMEKEILPLMQNPKGFWNDLNFSYKSLRPPRTREILIPLMESFNEILVKTEKELLPVLQNPRGDGNNVALWICSTWMNFCIQEGFRFSDDLFHCLSRVRILTVIDKVSTDKIRDELQVFGYWDYLHRQHKTMYDEFMEIYSESPTPVQEIRTLVTLCREIQLEMFLAVNKIRHRT